MSRLDAIKFVRSIPGLDNIAAAQEMVGRIEALLGLPDRRTGIAEHVLLKLLEQPPELFAGTDRIQDMVRVAYKFADAMLDHEINVPRS